MATVLAQLGGISSGIGTVLGAIIALVASLAAQLYVARATQRQSRRQSRTTAYMALATAVHYLSEALRLPQKATEAGLKPAPDGILHGLFEALLHLSWHQAARPGNAGLKSPKLSIARPMRGVAEWKP